MTHACRTWPRKPAAWAVLAFSLALVCRFVSQATAAEEKSAGAASSETRLYDAVRYLAGDELEGRGVGSRGLDQAVESYYRAVGSL